FGRLTQVSDFAPFARAAFVRMKNTTPAPEGWHLCRKPFAYIFKLRQERHLSFFDETTGRKSENRRHSKPLPGGEDGDIFSTKNNMVSLKSILL
ncbi:MAG: hypothetical protein D6714_03175, partial [Bacteroidetes bacterium]